MYALALGAYSVSAEVVMDSSKSSLDFEQIKEMSKVYGKTPRDTLCTVLKENGKNFEKINLLHVDFSSALETDSESDSDDLENLDDIIKLICRYCKNLKTLKLPGELMTKQGLTLLEKNIFPNLEAFKITKCDELNNPDDVIFKSLIQSAPKLKSLSINGNHNITGDSLLMLKRSFKKFEFLDCDYLVCHEKDFLIKLLRKNPALEVLKIIDIDHTIPYFNALSALPIREHLVKLEVDVGSFFKDIKKAALPFPNLRCLYLRVDHWSVNNGILARFHELFPKLEKFKYSEYDFDDNEAEVNSYNPWEDSPDEDAEEYKREHKEWLVELSGGKRRDADGIKKLAKCPNLKCLKFFHLSWLTGDSLVHLAVNTNGRFESLGFPECKTLHDAEMIAVVSLCPRLTYLDVSKCENLTNNFLNAVVQLMYKRSDNIPLKIKCTQCQNCDSSMFENRHPLLTFADSNYRNERIWW